MAVRLANPQLVITSDHFTQHRRPSTAVLHISIEELRSEQAVTTAPHRAFINVLPAHEVREIVGQRLDMQMDG